MEKRRICIAGSGCALDRTLVEHFGRNDAIELVPLRDIHRAETAIYTQPFGRLLATMPDTVTVAALGNLTGFLASCRHHVARIMLISNVGIYSPDVAVPYHPELLWDGYPASGLRGVFERATAAFAASLQDASLLVQHVILDGTYGPGDDFEDDGRVIPALVQRFCLAVETGATTVAIRGSGEAKRSFIHYADVADGIEALLNNWDGSGTVNLGGTHSVKITDLVTLVKNFAGYQHEIVYDVSFPDGRPDSIMDASDLQALTGFVPRRKFVAGICETVKYFQNMRKDALHVADGS